MLNGESAYALRDSGVTGKWRVGRFFVNFEPFCGNTKPVERPGSRDEQEISHEEARENAKKEWRVASNWWRG